MKLTAAMLGAIELAITFDKNLPPDADPFEAMRGAPCPFCGHVLDRADAVALRPDLEEVSQLMVEAMPERMRPLSRATLGHYQSCSARASRRTIN